MVDFSQNPWGLFIDIYVFVIGVFFLIYLPGRFLNKLIKSKNSFFEDLFLSGIYGILLFTLLSFICAYLKIDFLVIIIIAIIDLYVLIHIKLSKISFKKSDLLIYLVVFLLSLMLAVPMLTSGYIGDSLRLVGVNNYDGLWYLSLINELKVHFPPEHPGFSGEMLSGYHFLLFFLMAKIGSILNISNINLMFKLFPLLISLLWGIGVYALMLSWSKSKTASLFAVFLTMFGGSFVFFSWIEGHKNLSLDSGYGILQPATSLVNPTYAISIVLMTAFFLTVLKYYTTKSAGWLIPLTLIVGLTPLFKVYGGIILLGGFILFAGLELLKRKFYIVLAVIGVVLLFFAIYWPFTDKEAHLILYPFWAPHNVLKDNLPWYGYEEKIRTYSEQGVIRGLIVTELYAFYIFFIGNVGSRIIGIIVGIFRMIKEKKLPSVFSLLVFAMASASIVIPLLFIQSGKVFETIQFAWYFLFIISLFSALGFGYLFSFKFNKFFKIILVFMIIVITIPSAAEGLYKYFSLNGSLVEDDFYMSTKFLSERGDYNDTVLSLPTKNNEIHYDALRRSYRSGRPMIPALANKRSFLSYEYFDFKELDVKGRIMFINSILLFERDIERKSDINENLKNKIKTGFKNYNVKYLHSPYPLKSAVFFDNMKEVFGSPGAYIYEIK